MKCRSKKPVSEAVRCDDYTQERMAHQSHLRFVDAQWLLWYSRPVNRKSVPRQKDGRPTGWWRSFRGWLEPGLGVKRWLGLMIIGTALIGLGVAVVLLDVYRKNPGSPWLGLLALSAWPRWLRAVVMGTAGIGLFMLGLTRLYRALLSPFTLAGRPMIDNVAEHRRLKRGPKIVAIGGGTGLATLLRGLKGYSANITAVVTVADDGGSSGRLRRSMGLLPPGDLRNCLAALSDDEALLTQLFQYRFTEGDDLSGHSFGNLFIAALAGATGSFDQGILEAGKVLAIRGRVLPATLADVSLAAEKTPEPNAQSVRIMGESSISAYPGRILRVNLEPNSPAAYPEAIRAILSADMIIIGPGSLFTSVLPPLLVRDVADAIRASKAFRVYVCNITTQPGETDGFDVQAHLQALEDHVGEGLIDLMLLNNDFSADLPQGVAWVKLSAKPKVMIPAYESSLGGEEVCGMHNPYTLAERLMALLEEKTGPLEMPLAANSKPRSELK